MNCPTGKISHPSRAFAQGEAKRLVVRDSAKRGKRIRAYKCDRCPGWHIGHAKG